MFCMIRRTRLQSGIDKAEMIARDVVEQQIALNQKYVEVGINLVHFG